MLVKTQSAAWARDTLGSAGGIIAGVPEDAGAPNLEKIALQTSAPADLLEAARQIRASADPGWAYFYNRALGSGERYGPNNNADFFSSYWLRRNHPTFISHAKLYREHDKRPDAVIGRIFASAYNPAFDTVDVIYGAPRSIVEREMEAAIRARTLMTTSMGALVPWDECCYCGNRASRRADYCMHMALHPMRIYDGRLIYCTNHNPIWDDLSIVEVPAEPVAASVQKVASMMSFEPPRPAARGPRGCIRPGVMQQVIGIYKRADLLATLDAGLGALRPDEFAAVIYGDASLLAPGVHPIVQLQKTARGGGGLGLLGDIDGGLAHVAHTYTTPTPGRQVIWPMEPGLRAAYGEYLEARG